VARIGYARVSTRGQNDDSQVDELNAHGVDKLFIDHGVRGKHAARPELGKALGYLREGDVFVITRLSRAMRSLKDMLVLVDDLQKRGIDLVVTKQGIAQVNQFFECGSSFPDKRGVESLPTALGSILPHSSLFSPQPDRVPFFPSLQTG